MIEHAQGVIDAQRRLPAPLRANSEVIGDLALGTVLRRIVETACELVGAPYGAVGVVRPGGSGLEEFVHVGLERGAGATIGDLPGGQGLLGALIEDSRSVGFPDGHPPMQGFLGVPIRVGDEVLGNLYLAAPHEGEFSAEDEELVAALAATAGVAVDNARLYDEAKQRQRWLGASTDAKVGGQAGLGRQ